MPLPEARTGARAAPRGRATRCATLGAVLLSAAQLGCVHLRGTVEQPAILNLRIEGMSTLDEAELEARLATRESDRSPHIPIAGPLLHQTTGIADRVFNTHKLKVALVDPDQLAVDRQRIEAYYRERGFYDVKVSEAEVIATGDRQADVVYRVEEGEPVHVASIEITGLDGAPEARAALGKLPIAEGDRFTVMDYDAARARLLEALKNNGWATAQVGQEAQVLPEEHRVLVRYAVDAGSRYRFGPIFVAGAGSVPRDRIREQAGLEIRPGDWYDESRLLKSQGRVLDMGVFGGVRVNRGTPDAARGTIPVVVAVREAPFRTIRVGPSVGSQGIVSGSRFDLSGTVGWSHRNFLGDLRKLDLNLRLGYAWLLTKEKNPPRDVTGLATAEFSQPGAVTRNIDATVRLELERGLEQAYRFWSERLRLGLPIRLERRLTLVPSYNLDIYQLFQKVRAPDPNDPTQPATLQFCTRSSTCLLSYLEQRIGWDGRDDPVNPRRGAYLMLAVQEGIRIGSLGYRYLRFLPEARGYLPLGERSVLAARAQLGALLPVGETDPPPIVARFFGGGSTSMRGYGVGRLSPMVCRSATGSLVCSGDWVAVGGSGMSLYSLELRFPIEGALMGAVFTDAGYVTGTAKKTSWRGALSLANLQWAAGAGIRYRTPFGPLRLDLAARLPTRYENGVSGPERFPPVPNPDDPSVEHREPIVVFHLTIGESF